MLFQPVRHFGNLQNTIKIDIDSNATDTFKAQKNSKDIIKIVHAVYAGSESYRSSSKINEFVFWR